MNESEFTPEELEEWKRRKRIQKSNYRYVYGGALATIPLDGESCGDPNCSECKG